MGNEKATEKNYGNADEETRESEESEEKTKIYCLEVKKKFKPILGHVGLLVALVLYTIFGGFVFRQLEFPAEQSRLKELQRVTLLKRQDFIGSIVNGTDVYNFERLMRVELREYELMVQEAATSGLSMSVFHDDDEDRKSSKTSTEKWNLLQAIFFASTVVTTIGFGDVAPQSVKGRTFCILFALVGIPLTLTVIADWGKFLAEIVARIRTKFPRDLLSCMPRNSAVRKSLGALAAMAFFFIYLSCGALTFMLWEEDWTFFEGFYFCFVTMTTIGFGDLILKDPKYMLLCTVYILLGLALTSTILELVRRQYASSWRKIQALQGVFSEALKKIGDQRGSDMFNPDLRKVLTAMSIPRLKRGSTASRMSPEKEWEEAIKAVLHNISSSPQPMPKKPIIQIFIYESSV